MTSSDPIADAERAVALLARDYLVWASEDLIKMRLALLAGRRDDLFQFAHDMKGQGGSFGFPLLTQIAEKLCRSLERGTALVALTPYLDAVETILQAPLRGEGGEAGAALLAELACAPIPFGEGDTES